MFVQVGFQLRFLRLSSLKMFKLNIEIRSRFWGVLVPDGPTWRKWTWSSVWQSLSSSPLVLLSSAISLWIFSSASSEWPMTAFSWNRSSSFTSARCFSIVWINLEKILSLSSTTASVECCGEERFFEGLSFSETFKSPDIPTLMYRMTYFRSFSVSFNFCMDFKEVSLSFF